MWLLLSNYFVIKVDKTWKKGTIYYVTVGTGVLHSLWFFQNSSRLLYTSAVWSFSLRNSVPWYGRNTVCVTTRPLKDICVVSSLRAITSKAPGNILVWMCEHSSILVWAVSSFLWDRRPGMQLAGFYGKLHVHFFFYKKLAVFFWEAVPFDIPTDTVRVIQFLCCLPVFGIVTGSTLAFLMGI